MGSQLALACALCFLCLGFRSSPPNLISQDAIHYVADHFQKTQQNVSEPEFPIPYAAVGTTMTAIHVLPLIASIDLNWLLAVSVFTVTGSCLLAFFLYIFRRGSLDGAIKAPIRGNVRHPIMGLIFGVVFFGIATIQKLLGPGVTIY